MLLKQVLVSFDGGNKASLYCILKNVGKNYKIGLVSQKSSRITGLRAGTINKQFQ